MDELDLFRSFRREVSAPSEDAQRRASALLARAVDREQAPGRRFLGPTGKRARSRVLVLAVLAGATAIALFLTAPWSSSPSFLERAEAALTPPQGMILHEKWVRTSSSCTFRSTAELWFEFDRERIGQRYRAVVHDNFFPYPFKDTFHHPRCSRGSTYEIGGFTNGDVFRFVPPNSLVGMGFNGGPPPNLADAGDLVTPLRRALHTGNARDEGRTKRDGRTVEHIRIKAGDGYEWDAYVDPDTYYPVEIDRPGEAEWADAQIRFRAYEYLPRTAANVALTNIRAQHPHATGWPY